MISDENAAAIKDAADNMKIDISNRNTAIRHALKHGATVGEVVRLTGLTRARIYQIRDGR